MAKLISVADAWQHVAKQTRCTAAERIGLAESLGRVLFESVSGSQDVPAYDKSLVDGIAIRLGDLPSGRTAGDEATVEVIETIYAGRVPTHALATGQAARIMTGAPMPVGADAAVMVEKTRRTSASGHEVPAKAPQPTRELVAFLPSEVTLGQHIMSRGAAYRAGLPVASPGSRMRAVEVGVLAELGCCDVTVYRRPRVTLIQTGDELVPPAVVPGPGQIRNSNGMLLEALSRGAGAEVHNLGIVRDTADGLRDAVVAALGQGDAACDVLVLCGGVSAGEKDLVPQVLAEAGVERVFHKVNIRPGKPLWFGVKPSGHDRCSTLVFGLPGNPVSGLVSFMLFVAPALARLEGELVERLPFVAELAEPFELSGARPAYWPGKTIRNATGQTLVAPLAWRGSADPFSLVSADCLAHFPQGDCRYEAGTRVDCLSLR